ncbi:reverse transcriptase domain-containing protein, partial [Tanacetum coccineum]
MYLRLIAIDGWMGRNVDIKDGKNQKEPEQNPETSTEKVQNPNLENTAHVPPPGEEDSIFIEIPKPKAKKTVNLDPNSPNPNSYQSKLPYPERMKVRENDKPSAQHSRFLKMFKQLRLEIGLKDALVEMPKFNKWLSSLLRNKEKLEEIAITTVNAECSAIIMNKVPEKLEDPGKFLIPCALQELNRTSALADSGASINLLPHSIYKKLELEALTPTRMTLELANRSITHPMGIAEDVVVRVDETLTLRVGKEELVYYADKSEKNKEKNFVHAISIIDFSKDDPFSGSTTNTLPPSSSPVKTSDNLEKFADELAPLDSLPPGNDDSTLKKDFHEETFQVYSNPLFEFDDNFKSSNVNPLFEENDKDAEIKSSSSFTLTSPEESEFEAYLEIDSIPPGIDLTLPPTLEVSSSNPTSPTLTGEKLLENYQTERDNFQKARTEILGYQMSLESLEVILKTHEKNEYAWGDKYEQMEYDLKMRDLKLEEKQKELDQALRERDDFKVKLEKWSNAAVLQNEVLNKQRYLSDKTCIGFGVEYSSSEENNNSSGDETLVDPLYENFKREKAYKAVPPPTGTIIPPRANVSFTGIDELAIRNKVVNQEKTKTSQPEIDRNKVIIEDWVDSDDEETDFSEIQKKTVFNSENSETSFENKYSETSFENKSPNSQNSVGQESRTKGLGNKGGKLCFVCYSPDHLIKDCNLHERTFKQTQTHKPKGTQGSRDTRPVWNNINRVNHSNFSGNSRYPHQKRSFTPSAVLTREGLKSTARPKMTRTVPSKSTANVFYQGTARPRLPHAVLSKSTGRPYYPRMDNIRPRTSSFSPSSRSSTTRTPYRPQRPKKIMKSIWVKKGSTVGSQAVLPQNERISSKSQENNQKRASTDTRIRKVQSRSQKSQASIKSSQSHGAHKCKARDKSVFPRDSFAQDQAQATVKAQIYVGFVLNSLTKLAQTSHQGNDTLAILRCAQVDQTATIDDQMIEEMIGQD